jgi:glycosyltransferase involved in cell wall biosynthesis
MNDERLEVAVLLATYNGCQFVEAQIRSLTNNVTPFTVHWLDDHSTDETRDEVRAAAKRFGVNLREWHQPTHLGVPGTFFSLIERVGADIYLFCDQDDIWQPGKIDATVANLLPDVTSPVLCFSDPLTFRSESPEVFQPLSQMIGADSTVAAEESRLFMLLVGPGHTQGFTRPLRDLCLSHIEVARTHAGMHDWWLYIIASAAGTTRLLSNVPTTLHRRHGNNFSNAVASPKGNRLVWTWQIQHMIRHVVSRQAEGFLLVSETLPPGPKLRRVTALARHIARLNRRQSPLSLLWLIRSGAMWPSIRWSIPFSVACLCTHAAE